MNYRVARLVVGEFLSTTLNREASNFSPSSAVSIHWPTLKEIYARSLERRREKSTLAGIRAFPATGRNAPNNERRATSPRDPFPLEFLRLGPDSS